MVLAHYGGPFYYGIFRIISLKLLRCKEFLCLDRGGMSISEKVYFEKSTEKGKVLVTSTRFVINDDTYFIDNITSVSIRMSKTGSRKVRDRKQEKTGGWAFIISAITAASAFLGLLVLGVYSRESPFILFLACGGVLLVSGLSAGISLLAILSATRTETYPNYHMFLTSASGEKDALISENLETIRSVADAVNHAKSG